MHHKVHLFDEMTREVLRQVMTLSIASELREAALRFLNGNPSEKNLDIYTDDQLSVTIGAAYHGGLLEGYVREYADSIMHRRTGMRALWKRDEDYITTLGLGNAVMLNRYIDENLEGKGLGWAVEFKQSIINELRRILNCDCRLLVSVASFINDIGALIRNSDGNLMPINEASPLIKAIDNAWEQTPHIFIFVNSTELETKGINPGKVKEEAVKVLTRLILNNYN
jgi:HD superfamily phosphohydrolase